MNNALIKDPIFHKLKFTQDWIDTGIINRQNFIQIKKEFLELEDKNSEHYRWRAFRSFLETNQDISAKTLHQIYALAESDPDYAMGRSMRFQIIRHINCPVELIDAAIEGEDTGLSKKAFKLKETIERLM